MQEFNYLIYIFLKKIALAGFEFDLVLEHLHFKVYCKISF